MSLFSRKSSVLALSVEDSTLRLACAMASEGEPAKILEHTSVALPTGIVVRQRILKIEEFVTTLKEQLAVLKRKPSTVLCALPPGLVYTLARTNLKEAPTAKGGLAQMLAETLPVAADKLTTREQWNAQGGVWTFLATEKEVLDSYRAACKAAGLSSVTFVPLSFAASFLYAKDVSAENPAIIVNLTTNPMSITKATASAILDERILFDETMNESLPETLQTWLPNDTTPSLVIAGDDTATTALTKSISAKHPALKPTVVKSDEWAFASLLASAQLAKPPLPTF